MNFLIPNQVTLSDLRSLMQILPQTPDNQDFENYLLQLIRAKEVTVKPYIYTYAIAGLAGGATSDGTLQIANDADFLVLKKTYSANVGNAAQSVSDSTNPLVDILIKNNAGDQMMKEAASLTALFGTGLHPFQEDYPWQLAANSTVAITATNLTAATTYNIKLHFHGLKLSRAKG